MRKRICRQVMCLTLAVMLVVGLMPGIAMTAHANTTITEITVNDVTAPEVGETPDYSASVPTGAAYYIGTDITGTNSDVNGILWVNNGNSPIKQDAAFLEDGSYDVRMEIYAKDGASFAEKEDLTVTINGQPAYVISRTDTMIYIRYTFGTPTKKEIITSIELYHDSDIEAKSATKNLVVSKINGEAFEGTVYVGYTWYRSTSNFTDINDAGVSVWDDSKDAYKFVGGYAYGLKLNRLPEIEGYAYGKSVVVSLKTPGSLKTTTADGQGDYYFFYDKLAYKPDLESVDITMDGYYVGANVLDLKFSSSDPIKTEGGSGVNSGRYTIRKYNAETQQYDILSNTLLVAGEKYYLFFYLESDLDVEGLARENVKVNGMEALSKGKENGRTYYMFSLPILTVEEVVKTKVSSVAISMPDPAAGDSICYPTVISVNDDTNLADAVSLKNSQWYQNDYDNKEGIYEPLKGDQFVQGKSYQLWLCLKCSEDYALADNCIVTLQTPSGNLKGELEYNETTSLAYNYYFNLGAPTELPELASYEGELSGYTAGSQVQDTQLEIKVNGKTIPEVMTYGMMYAILDENQQFIEQGIINYDTQYYCSMMVAQYNCKMDGITEEKIKEVVTLNGIKPESAVEFSGIWLATFKLPILKEETTCNGVDHNFKTAVVPATTAEDGKVYEICINGCNTIQNVTVIPRIESVKLAKEYYIYDGNIKKPAVTVKDRNGYTLVEGQDYKVTYPTSSKKTGLYVVDVVMMGKYEGLESLGFQILPAVETTKLSSSSIVYNGKAKSPSVIVKDSTGTALVKNWDYTVTVPKGRTAIGKYTYTIKFKERYAELGSKTLVLTIKPAKPTIQAPKAAKKAVTVKWKKAAKAQTTGYQVMVATDSKFKKNVKKAFSTGYSKTSYKMTKLKAKTKYYVKVRSYKTVKGVKIYSDWSKVKTIKTL